VKLYRYQTKAEYIQIQVAANKEKLDFVWVRDKNVKQIASWLQHFGMKPRVGLCHGTRGGQEQKLFTKYLPGCAMLGTDIAPTASSFPLTIQWDFHDPMWKGVCDFVYSNSLDHAWNPMRAVRTWLASLVSGGILIIEWGSNYEQPNKVDPFGATIEELLTLIEWCGGEVMAVDDAEDPQTTVYLKLVYIRRRRFDEIDQCLGRKPWDE